MARITGSRTVAPQSGQINYSANTNFTPNVSQGLVGGNSLTTIRSDATNLRGRLVLTAAGTIQALVKNLPDNVGNVLNNPNGGPPISIDQTEFSTTAQRKLAQAYFGGGVGIEKDLSVGGFIYGRIAAANTATTSSNIVVLKTNADELFFPIMTNAAGTVQQGANLYVDLLDQEGLGFTTSPKAGLKYNPYQGKLITERVEVNSTETSVSTMTGAFTVTGGVGIGEDIWIGGNVMPALVGEQNIGAQDQEWANAYLNQIYTKFLGSTASSMTIAPGLGQTDIYGNLRVRDGDNPIGTAPVVTNTLYVTMDGDDTNDGRAQDPSRACRTIGAALKSPYYQPGTQILVSAGRYLEDNPLVMKEYTSIRGSDIRTTFIEPINKTQDLFHVTSGCYLNYMTFLNGRSGLLEGQYDTGYNRGAYAAAFPPQTGDNRIDLFQSPYIQNCTNQSGPWLKDGTMFVPNQTVQIPLATGTASWTANTASIIVNVESGSIEVGQSINVGKPNQGFFNARTLLLANKPFIQSQTVAWVDATFNSGSFSYDKVKCARDTGLIVNSIAQDMLYESTSNSVFSGIQYWNQDGYTGQIPNEITATIQAITYVKGLVENIAFTAGGSGAQSNVSARFNEILNILDVGTSGITDTISVNGLPSTVTTTTNAYASVVAAIPDIQDQTINYIDGMNLVPNYSYNQTKCSRDTGLIVDALAQDLLFGGTSQSTFAGIQYWNQTGYIGAIGGELTTTTAAINYVKSLAQKLVLNDVSGIRYQSTVSQILNVSAAGSSREASIIGTEFSLITSIINGGTDGVSDIIVPNNLTASTTATVLNAYNLLQANKDYLKAEAIAFVEATKTAGFSYNKDKCYRDTGLIVDAIAQDVMFAGTSQSTFAGIQYWNQNGYVGAIGSELTTTTNAINWIKSIAQKIVKNDTSGTRYGVGTQITGAGASATEASELGAKFDVITDILVGGVAGVTDIIVPNGLTTSTNSRIWNAYQLLQANKAYLQAEAVAYVEATKTAGFTYDQTTCSRDVGYIIDSVSIDLLYGGNRQSVQSGVYYYGYNGSSSAIATELPQTTAAYNHIKTMLTYIVAGTAVPATYQSAVTQNRSLTPGNSAQTTNAQNKINIITGIINGGPGTVTSKTPISITPSADINAINTAKIIEANRVFIQAETIAYIDSVYPAGFQYDQATCARDVDYMVDSVSFDLLYSGNRQAVQSGVYYWGYTGSSAISGETVQTTAAYNYLRELLYYVIQGKLVPTTYDPSPQNILLPAGTIQEVLTAQGNIDLITNIINNGPSQVSEKRPIGLSESNSDNVRNASAILEANKVFIQSQVVAYINTNFSSGYDKAKCRRDVSYIVSSVAFDLLHGGNYQSIKSGVYYYSYNNISTLSASNEIPQTTAAYNFIKSIISNIVTTEPLLSTYQTLVPQITSYDAGSSYEVETLQSNIDTITNIIRNGPTVAGALTPININESPKLSALNAYNILTANIPFIKAEVIAFLDQTMNNFSYNRQLCYRDAGIILENMAYDMAFGGNEKSRESGLSYYKGVTSVIAGQETQTIGAIDYIGKLASLIVMNEPCPVLIPPANTPVNSQVINTALTGGEIAVPAINHLLNVTTDIILKGNSAAPELVNSAGPDAAFVAAEVLLQANRAFIQENVINYINYNLCYPVKTLPYNQIKCRRDTRVILDSIAQDLLFPTPSNTQATFAGLQYFVQESYTGLIKEEINPTIDAIAYLRDIAIKVVQNITAADDALVGVYRYTSGTQVPGINSATTNEIEKLRTEFNTILTILKGKVTGWTDLIVPNSGETSNLPSVKNTVDILLANVDYIANEVNAYVNATYEGFSYDQATCARDIGYILQSLAYDLTYGGNRQAIQSGLSYYVSPSNITLIPGETDATVDAFTFMANVASTLIQGQTYYPLQTKVKPITGLPLGTSSDGQSIIDIVNTITNIIANGPSVSAPLVPITLDASTDQHTRNAYNIVIANKEFIVAEVIAHLDKTFNSNSFNYNQELCYRDTGLIIDAVSQDILLGGNSKSIEAGASYWNQGYNYVAGQESTTTLAINYARDLALQVIANTPVASVTGTIATQVINPFYQYGGDYMPQQAVARNFGIITKIITEGVSAAPPVYQGGGLFSPSKISADSVNIASKVTSVDILGPNTVRIGLDRPSIGFANNATLYFGDTLVYPLQNFQVDKLSTQLSGSASTWNHRKVDDIGAMGGALIDGAVISDRSPIQSFVFDAYTQLNQGGIGVKVTNNGYSQLVSVFTIFCKVGVVCDNGGIASITNSNCNFGDISLLAKGYGRRDFSGTVFNPAFRSYPFSPDGVDTNGNALPYLDQFYPEGYWPNNGKVEIFVPDDNNRPHIGLVMEVVSPEGHINEQGFPAFLNAQPSTSTLTTGTINLTNISTNDVYVGNTVYVRDQYGREWDDNGIYYAAPGTIVTDVNYNSVSLNKALTSGGGDPTNTTYFTIYFCGNSYYTVQTSQIASNPYRLNKNILSSNSDLNYMGPTISQIGAHVAAINYLKTVTDKVIANIEVTPSSGNGQTQVISPNVAGGANAQAFIDLRFTQMVDIIRAPNIDAANAVVPANLITTKGTIPAGAGSAVTLIESNIDFIAAEVTAYVTNSLSASLGNYNQTKCIRDVKLILQQIIYDLQTGGNYNSVYSGLSYWGRSGTYHIVELGEAVNRPDLFPDGAIVNFYQRSYISASGYLFEYVGAGTNYGALPQRGVADPVQGKETVQLNSGKVFFTSTDQNGDFRIGPGLVISQATGVLSGRTFVQSLYANMTPFILAIS
jgi:hypothetical protein